MKSTIQVGNSQNLTFVVTQEMQPRFHDAIVHPVCSTWDLAHQFEIVARKTLEPHLCEGEQGIGSSLSIEHNAPIPVGKSVDVIATITELDATTVICSITASIGDLVCATGIQTQRVLPITTLDKIIQKAISQ